MNEIFTAALTLMGAAFGLLAAAGVIRMPDLFMRMQAATKASTLGIGCIMLAVAVHFGEVAMTTRALAAICFVFLTAPVAAHMIARASYFVGVPLWEGTIIDELRGHYDRRTHRLARPDDPFAVLPMTVDLNRLAGHVVLVGYGRVGRRIARRYRRRRPGFYRDPAKRMCSTSQDFRIRRRATGADWMSSHRRGRSRGSQWQAGSASSSSSN